MMFLKKHKSMHLYDVAGNSRIVSELTCQIASDESLLLFFYFCNFNIVNYYIHGVANTQGF